MKLKLDDMPSVLFGKCHVLFAGTAWFLARRDDAVVVGLLQGGATSPGATMTREESSGFSKQDTGRSGLDTEEGRRISAKLQRRNHPDNVSLPPFGWRLRETVEEYREPL